MRGIQVADDAETDTIRETISSLWDQSAALRCMRKLIFSPNKACASCISIYCTRCAMDENLQLLVARQWNRNYWSVSLADTRRHGETRHRLHPMNCIFDQLLRISFPFTRIIKLIRHGSCVTIPFHLKQFNIFSIFNNEICIGKKFKFYTRSIITFLPIN